MAETACTLLSHDIGVVGALSPPAYAQALAEPKGVPAGVIAAQNKSVARSLDFIGRVDAVQRVEIRARTAGYLENVLFNERDLI